MRDLNPRPSKQRRMNVPFQQLHQFFSERLANSFSEEIQFEHASTFFSDHGEIIFRSIFHDPIPHIFLSVIIHHFPDIILVLIISRIPNSFFTAVMVNIILFIPITALIFIPLVEFRFFILLLCVTVQIPCKNINK